MDVKELDGSIKPDPHPVGARPPRGGETVAGGEDAHPRLPGSPEKQQQQVTILEAPSPYACEFLSVSVLTYKSLR